MQLCQNELGKAFVRKPAGIVIQNTVHSKLGIIRDGGWGIGLELILSYEVMELMPYSFEKM